MKSVLLSLCAGVLTGCCTIPQGDVSLSAPVVKETHYIVRVPPAELMRLPAKPPRLNVDTADQADVAEWVLLKERYVLDLENNLKQIAKFFKTEQDAADAKAAEENKKSGSSIKK